MTNTCNIAGQNGSVMVPVLSENGSLMAYLLYPNPQGILEEYYPAKAIPRQYLGNTQAIPPQDNTPTGRGGHDCVLSFSQLYKDFLCWTGQPFLLFKNLKKTNMAKEPSKGLASDRIKNDPTFERTRENMAEFGRAGKASRLTREIFRDVTIFAKDSVTQARLHKVFSRVLMTDPVSRRGERTVGKGDQLQLKGFNFNVRAGLRETFYVRCPIVINRPTGQVVITIPSFVPKVMVQAPGGTTHFRIVAATATVNFDTEAYEYMRASTDEVLWDQVPYPGTNLELTLPINSPDTILVALGIEFSQRVNNQSYALKTGDCNATTIMRVDQL
ncbi:hypothetical protein [Paraflavitalea speifideaquila]|uniref:hypothetical protein n=1 Tax=Paraflavitalea speifideaquila TaxID=3076558 RepID=UPI0028E428D0|nr:hypothetical protein [Paraflavitalea speifideiaquila]